MPLLKSDIDDLRYEKQREHIAAQQHESLLRSDIDYAITYHEDQLTTALAALEAVHTSLTDLGHTLTMCDLVNYP